MRVNSNQLQLLAIAWIMFNQAGASSLIYLLLIIMKANTKHHPIQTQQQTAEQSFTLTRSLTSQIIQNHNYPEYPQGMRTKQQIEFDFYMMDYSSQAKKYHLTKSKQESETSLLKEIADLILTYPRVHMKPLPSRLLADRVSKTKVMKPIIMPIADGKRFAYIFETSDFSISNKCSFQIRDKFLIFIADTFLPYTLSEYAKAINKKEIQDRLKSFSNDTSLHQVNIPTKPKKVLLQQINAYLYGSKRYYFSKQQIVKDEIAMQTNWYLKLISDYSILIRLNTLHYRPILLLTLLIYYSIRQFKIIIIGYKASRHIMSEAVIALKAAYNPIGYCYPIILAAISEEHDNYMDSPVPALICYWGQERQCIKVRQKFKRMSKQQSMPTILIDLNSLTAFNSITTEHESRIMVNMNNYLTSGNYKTQVIQHANEYLLSLANSKNQELKQQSLLFRKSLAFIQFAYNNK